MAKDRATLEVAAREQFGSRTTRRLRRQGLVPGVVYGDGREATAFQVSARELRNLLQRAGTLFDLRVDGSKPQPVVVKEEQRDPVRGDLLHLDLLEVKLDVAITSDVPIELLGADEAPGVKEGGVLEHVTHQVTVSALPAEIPESLPVDVSGMEIGDTMQMGMVVVPEGVELVVDDPNEVTIATLSPPRVEEEAEPEVEEEAELVGEAEEAEEAEPEAEGESAQSEG